MKTPTSSIPHSQAWTGSATCCLTPFALLEKSDPDRFLDRLHQGGFYRIIPIGGRGVAVLTTGRLYKRGYDKAATEEEVVPCARHDTILWEFYNPECRVIMAHVPTRRLYVDTLISKREVISARFTRLFCYPLRCGESGIFGVRNQQKNTSTKDRDSIIQLVHEWMADYQSGLKIDDEGLDGFIFEEQQEKRPWLIHYHVSATTLTDYPFLDLYLRLREQQGRRLMPDIYLLPFGHEWLKHAESTEDLSA